MAHKKIIDSVKKQGQVAIKDLDEFLRFVINESDIRFSMRAIKHLHLRASRI